MVTDEIVAFCLAHPVAAFLESDLRYLLERLPRGPEGVFDLRDPSGARLVATLVERADSEANSADLVTIGARGGPAARAQLLLRAVEAAYALAASGPRSVLQVVLQPLLEASEPDLQARGFALSYRSHWMETVDAGHGSSSPPAGLCFEDWSAAVSPAAIDALVGRAFAGVPGFMRTSLEELELRLAQANPPARVLLQGREPIGLVRLRAPTADGVGVVSLLAREPAWRGRGLGDVLLVEAMRVLALAGSRRFGLEVVAHNTSALALYRRHGFTPVSTDTTLSRPLPRAHA